MKFKYIFGLFTLFLSSFAQAVNFTKTDLAKFHWQEIDFSQKITQEISDKPQFAMQSLAGTETAVLGYKIPANQGAIQLKLKSLVVENQYLFMPNILVLDENYNISLNYPASQFKKIAEQGFESNQLQAELNLTPIAGQDFIYLLIYTTKQDLDGQTIFPHPAKSYAKARGNQPPAIADLTIQHRHQGKIELAIDSVQASQFIGLGNLSTGKLNGALFETKPINSVTLVNNPKTVTPVEITTEQYFMQAVTQAIKNHDINKAMNLVNEAEKLGLTQPRQIFLEKVSAK